MNNNKEREKKLLYQREQYEKHKETRLAYQREYDKKHKEQIKYRRKKHYIKHKEIILARNNKWKKNNLDKVKKGIKKYRETHKEQYIKQCKEYRQTPQHKISMRLIMAKRKCGMKGLKIETDKINIILKEQKMCCIYCAKEISDSYHIDHIIPLSKGGAHSINNIQILCPKCNLVKTNKLVFRNYG